MHYAAKCNSVEVLTVLLERGGMINARSIGEDTPLHCAIERNSINAAVFLIKKGAGCRVKNKVSEQ